MSAGPLAARRDLLALVLDTLVPAGDGFPAGSVALDHLLAMAAASPDIASMLERGLQAIDETAGFARLDANDRERALARVERTHAGLFDALVRHTYDGYYSHPAVLGRLGLEPGPVQPRGHRIETAELPDLGRVRARGPLYRPA
jgi:gluconate 2-dehydrogenase subunit 3-like protein